MASEPGPLHRVAIYYAPDPRSAWWLAGSHWLGRCAAADRALAQPCPAGMDPQDFARLTAEPRRYGWHATLKAPFRLADGHQVETLKAEVQRICERRQPFELPPLQVVRMGSFLALRPAQAQPALEQLAADCVQRLQPLAAPLSDSELARRRRPGLTPQQDALLQAWGYPWVLDHFRFHLSLTGPLNGLPLERQEAIADAAAQHFGVLEPCRIDRVSIFAEPAPGADFLLLEQVKFQP